MTWEEFKEEVEFKMEKAGIDKHTDLEFIEIDSETSLDNLDVGYDETLGISIY